MSIDADWAFAFGFTMGGMVVSLGLLIWDALSIWWDERKETKGHKQPFEVFPENPWPEPYGKRGVYIISGPPSPQPPAGEKSKHHAKTDKPV